MVDDEYSVGRPEVEELLGICSTVQAGHAAALPHLSGIDFEADREIWVDSVRERWRDLDEAARQEVLERARAFEEESVLEGATSPVPEEELRPGTVEIEREPTVPEREAGDVPATAAESAGLTDRLAPVDTRAAKSLEEILDGLDGCTFVALSLKEWRERAEELLSDDMAATTVFLFDRDFQREQEGAVNEGFNLVQEVQAKDVGYCGLISHMIPLGSEYEAGQKLAVEHSLVRDKFVVIAKDRLTGESADRYGFLRMLRLVALSERCAAVKSAAWEVFNASVMEATAMVEGLSVLDFDQIVLASSRREGVWEPDTLSRVFSILMRRETQARLYEDTDFLKAVEGARRISVIPEEVATALGEEKPSREALRIQRFEAYGPEQVLSRFCRPLELGDIFERSGRRYILLTQQCDLMVRPDGKRSYDERLGRTGALVELVVGRTKKEAKRSWEEVPFYDEDTGAPAYADFAKVHQVQLAVLDLCTFREDGVAEIEIGAACPEVVIEPWKKRHERLQDHFRAALARYEKLEKEGVKDELKLLALPTPSGTVRFPATVNGKNVRYDLKRVMRLLQPWAGALLTAFVQYQGRAAFEHPFHRVMAEVELDSGDGPEDADGTDASG